MKKLKNEICKFEIGLCDECGSQYYSHTSKMNNVCAECGHKLYGYENCDHKFKNNRCENCYWNGNKSNFLKEYL